MSIQDPARRFDGFTNLSGGMDSGRSPEGIGETCVALGVNVTVRTGWPATRPSFTRLATSGAAGTFASGFFQGAGVYYNPTTGKQALLAASSGRIYEFNLATLAVTDLTPATGGNDPSAKHYFCQAESFMVIQSGADLALIYDGSTLRRAVPNNNEVPSGTMMAYGQGRLFVASNDMRELVAGDIVYGGSVTQVDVLRVEKVVVAVSPPVGKTGVATEFTMAKITTTMPHGFSDGDSITLQNIASAEPLINTTWAISEVTSDSFVVPFPATVLGTGGTAQRFNDGVEADLLRFTETLYLNEKGVFRLATALGQITGMEFFPVQDTVMGQGDLIVFGEHGAAAFQVSLPREQWLNSPIQHTVLTHIGATSPESVVVVNSDVFFRSSDGLRSFRNAHTEFTNSYSKTPLSAELQRIMQYESVDLLGNASAGLFDNRILFTVSPQACPITGGNPFAPVPTVFRGLGVLDFYDALRLSTKGMPSFDGVWTGLNILQLVCGRFGGRERAFIFAMAPDRTTELWELAKTSQTGCDIWDETNTTTGVTTRNSQPISCAVESKAFSFASPYSLKRLVRGDLWLADIQGNTGVNLFWRPDVHPYWFYWGSFNKDVQTNAGAAGMPPMALLPAIAPQITLPTPPVVDDDSVRNRPAHLGYTFQARLEWTGRMQVQKLILHALDMVEASQANAPGAAVLQTIPAQGAAVPTPAPTEMLAYSAR